MMWWRKLRLLLHLPPPTLLLKIFLFPQPAAIPEADTAPSFIPSMSESTSVVSFEISMSPEVGNPSGVIIPPLSRPLLNAIPSAVTFSYQLLLLMERLTQGLLSKLLMGHGID